MQRATEDHPPERVEEIRTTEGVRRLVIRPLRSTADFAACVALQHATWGENFSECVPPAILMVNQKIGGVSAGAFDEDGLMLGFVFGLTGVKNGRLVHWSDMLAVRPEARDLGLGRVLKRYQRDVVHALGVNFIYWTFDPLVARNAHLNLNRLGTNVVEYVLDMYGADTGSVLHRGIGSDRLVVEWDIGDASTHHVGHGKEIDSDVAFVKTVVDNGVPVLNDITTGDTSDAALPHSPYKLYRIEIPPDILRVQAESLETAARWRTSTRAAFQRALAAGLDVQGFYRDDHDRCFYVLGRHDDAQKRIDAAAR